jgi:uncharacterized membrane protein
MLVLVSVGVLVAGFLARLNPLLIVAAAALSAGLAAGLGPVETLSALGKAFNDNRYISLVWLVLPAIGLLEHAGLQARARALMGRARAATAGRLLMLYFVTRQLTAALGLTSLGGQAQMVRPLIAPMAEAAAEQAAGAALPDAVRAEVRAQAAATDNIAVFFGEDIFIAVASILLIKGFLQQNGFSIEPLQLSVWAMPTAAVALLVHAARMALLDRRLKRRAADEAGAPAGPA